MNFQETTVPIYFESVLKKYNPWWETGEMGPLEPPPFKRPVFERLIKALTVTDQIVSLTGPRRIGKTVLLRQIIEYLIKEGTTPGNITYFALDDPIVDEADPGSVFEMLISGGPGHDGGKTTFVFLDEVQNFPKWEKYLKREYDLNTPRRFVISGSASTPIFRASRESLLGRITDFHLPPFSYSEYVLYKYHERGMELGDVKPLITSGDSLRRDLKPENILELWRDFTEIKWDGSVSDQFRDLLNGYLIDGGFPQVWSIKDPLEKTQYLVDNHIKKVIREDLALAVSLRNADELEKLLYYLFANLGSERNVSNLSQEFNLARQTVSRYLNLLTQTELFFSTSRYSRKPFRGRKGNFKIYLADHSIRNGLLGITDVGNITPEALGYYYENVVYNVLRRWREATEISYYRDQADREIDFVISLGPSSPVPVEVKPGLKLPLDPKKIAPLTYFLNRENLPFGIVVGGNACAFTDKIINIPLVLFLLWFDPFS
jgi:predicted AAA+ superfamily ATPase